VNSYLDRHPDLISIFENPQLLFSLLVFEGGKDANIAKLMDRFFYPTVGRNDVPQLRTFAEILLIEREKLLKEARIRIPLAQRKSLFSMFLEWVRGFGKSIGRDIGRAVDTSLEQKKKAPRISEILQAGKENQDTSNAAKKTADQDQKAAAKPVNKKLEMEKQIAFIRKLQDLQAEMIGKKDRREMMDYYDNRWNRTINKTAKEDNLKLVHGKILHRVKFLQTPSMEQIRKEASDMIRTDETLQKVYDMESLKNYILLYIIEYYTQKEEKQK
jgi:hypothetical protein